MKYEVPTAAGRRNTVTCYLLLDTIFSMSNVELRFKNEEVEIRNGIGISTLTNFGEKCEFLFVPPYFRIRVLIRIPSLYMPCQPPGRYLVLDTIFSMSNAEH